MDWDKVFTIAINDKSYKSNEELLEQCDYMSEQWVAYAIKNYIDEHLLSVSDIEMLKKDFVECEEFYYKNTERRNYHFGYPANMPNHTLLYYIFSEYEKKRFLSNNCGDTFEKGNYAMDSKNIERSIIEIFADKFGIDKKSCWGYITSGGSESNAWGVNTGFQVYPDGILYYCESVHYSVIKNAIGRRCICIPKKSPMDEAIDSEVLLNLIRVNPEPAILILTWGTTRFGSCDDIDYIVKVLNQERKKYYIHVDAALYGGIPNNQIDAPIISQIDKLGIDSISVSLHKYLGVPSVKSVLIANQKPKAELISYIGMNDTTTSGSRDILPFSTRQQIIDVLKMSKPNDYTRNIILFEGLLKNKNIPYVRSGKGNIFVIDKPSDKLCKKYQLATFSLEENGIEIPKAHIIIFPYQQRSVINELVNDLYEERNKS